MKKNKKNKKNKIKKYIVVPTDLMAGITGKFLLSTIYGLSYFEI